MKRIRTFLIVSGIWVWITLFPLLLFTFRYVFPDIPMTGRWITVFAGITGTLNLILFVKNIGKINAGKSASEITPLEGLSSVPDEYSSVSNKRKYQYPAINPKISYKHPEGFCLGKDPHTGMYVCRSFSEEGSILINGGSGTGKSSCYIINYLLLSKGYGEKGNGTPQAHNFAIDIKHELADLTARKGDGSIIIDPTDHNSYGIDPFYELSPSSSDGEVYKVMSNVAVSLIPPMPGPNEFFSLQARELLKGCFLYYYKYRGCTTFTEVLRQIFSRPIQQTIEEILTGTPPGSPAYISVVDFASFKEPDAGDIPQTAQASETVTSIFMNFKSKASALLADEDLAYALGDNPKKFTPEMLLSHDVYFCIPKDQVQQYGQLTFLTLNMVFLWVMALPERRLSNRLPIGIVLDEVVALLDGMGGRLAELVTVLRLARSVGAFVIMCVQSISGLKCVYSDSQVEDMLSNLPYRIILDATTVSTQKMVIDAAGKFKERKVTYANNGGKRTQTTTFEEKNIVDGKDLIELGGSDEMILISTKTGYCRLKKVPYYKDAHYRKILPQKE